MIDRATSEERRRKCPIERRRRRAEKEGEGDGIYNIYVSSAIRRCLLASLRLRTRRRIMVTSAGGDLAWSVSVRHSVGPPRNECCNQTENEEGRNGGKGGRGFGAYSMTLLAAGRRTDGRTRRRDACPIYCQKTTTTRLGFGRRRREKLRARIHIASPFLRAVETSSRRVEGHRSPSSDFCIRGGGSRRHFSGTKEERRRGEWP